jgi:DNA polymerase
VLSIDIQFGQFKVNQWGVMKTIFLDFETFYGDDYTLRKMTPVEYVLDPRFEVTILAVQEGLDGTPYILEGSQLPDFFKSLDPKDTLLVTHNALFDMCIVAWRYNFIPRLMVCTMNTARATLGGLLRRVSLASVSAHLGLPAKGDCIHKVKNMNLSAIKAIPSLFAEYKDYAKRDVANCAGIYKELVINRRFPVPELLVMDSVLRCAIEPHFRLDKAVLTQHQEAIRVAKEHQLAQAMLVGAEGKGDLMSNEAFATLLRNVGVEPPTKVSPLTGNVAYAFAKTDPDFLDLQEHENPAVQALVAARLGHKSTLEESRCQRFLSMTDLQWPVTFPGNAPMPLRYSGAHTHRLSGDWSLNVQNLPRGGNLRRALIAPPFHKVFAIDSSQVEARGVAVLCGQDDLVEAFARGEDVYAGFASTIFSIPVNKKDNPNERFVGKEGILSLGYGAGAPKYQSRVKVSSKNQTGTAIELDDSQALHVVNTYRSKYAKIPAGWKHLNNVIIPALQDGGRINGAPAAFGPCVIEKEAILLPNGLRLFYHNLRRSHGEWWFEYGGVPKKLYGGKLLENITQALARIVVMEAATRIRKRCARFSLQAHDELVYVVPDALVEELTGVAMEEMTRRPVWMPDWPLAAESGVGQSYGDAK